MNTLHVAYQILYSLEHKKKADYMGVIISPERLKISESEWLDVLQTLSEEGYISGVEIKEDILGNVNADIENIRITMKGAEYLHENSTMKAIAKVASNIFTITKG